ncbi:integrase catalytic domain-containing protein [Nephila pilipes]|uniref:Integrase catalytic domain-containing protein n=1 Tax=Nephila pilipes TaxID=299642 RepID=A0A8X6U2X1_NEPPI|nr:integrase catalytic domain-containing protein [Nephila pilipes]
MKFSSFSETSNGPETAANVLYGFGKRKMPTVNFKGMIKADIEVDDVKGQSIKPDESIAPRLQSTGGLSLGLDRYHLQILGRLSTGMTTNYEKFVRMLMRIRTYPLHIDNAIIGSYYSDGDSPSFCFTINTLWSRPDSQIQKIKKFEKIQIEFFIDTTYTGGNVPLDEVRSPLFNPLSSPAVQMAIHSPYIVASPFVSGVGFLGGRDYKVKIKATFSRAKSRVFPLKQVTIPRSTREVKDLDMRDANHHRKRLKFRVKVIEELQKRFRSEYLGLLIQRQRQNPQTCNIRQGNIVLIGDDVKIRLQWPLSRVLELIPVNGNDRKSLQLQGVQMTESAKSPYPDFSVVNKPLMTRNGRAVRKPTKLNMLTIKYVFE